MGNLDVSVSVQDGNIVDQIEDAIVDGIEKAADKRRKHGIATQAEEVAKKRIREAGAVFTEELIESFEIDHTRTGGTWHVTLENTSDHAAPIEYGAEYGEEGPPVAALIPWVVVKMQGFDIPESDYNDIPEPDVIRNESSSIEYGPDVNALAPDWVVEKAFWLQQHIKEEGIDALRYMAEAEAWTEANAGETVAAFITDELNRI